VVSLASIDLTETPLLQWLAEHAPLVAAVHEAYRSQVFDYRSASAIGVQYLAGMIGCSLVLLLRVALEVKGRMAATPDARLFQGMVLGAFLALYEHLFSGVTTSGLYGLNPHHGLFVNMLKVAGAILLLFFCLSEVLSLIRGYFGSHYGAPQR
jgi:hypothetical protein